MKATARIGASITVLILAGTGCVSTQHVPSAYQGKPYEGRIQEIPGRLNCMAYDVGGEGIAYHDREGTNMATICCGSKFRVNEGVDVGVMDSHHSGSLNPGQPFLGWIYAGEWLKYTVQVKQSGVYRINAHMTSATTNGQIRFAINGQAVSGPISFSRATGNVHRWETYTNIAELHLKAGTQVLTLEFYKGQTGDQNFESFEFIRACP